MGKKNGHLISEEQALKAFCENMKLAWIAASHTGDVVQADENFCERTGFAENELIGKNISSLIHPDDKDGFVYDFSTNGQTVQAGQRRFLKKDGSFIFLSYKSLIVEDKNTKFRIWYINNWESIQQALHDLRKDSLFLKMLLKNTPDHIYFKDKESRFLLMSESFAHKMNAKSAADLIGKSDSDLFTDEHAKKALEDEKKIIETGKPLIGIEEKETWSDGRVTWASTSKMPHYDEEGKVIGTFGISRDITEKKLIELQIAEKSKILNGIVNNLPVIIFKINEKGDFSILQGNEERMANFKKSRTAKLSIGDTLQLARKKLIHNPINEDYFSFTSNFANEKEEGHFENFLFKDANEDRSFVGFSIDITERKQSEQELKRHSKNLQKINKELDQFAYVVSHDLKAPLRAINNLSEWIEEDIGDNIDDDVANNLKLLRGRVHRMQSLIDGILEYSRIGRMHIQMEPVDIDKFVADMVTNFSLSDSFTIIKKAKMPTIKINKIRLEQVFMNLISNAIKYHDKGKGTIVIDYEQVNKEHQFSVADDGPGISPEFHEKIFVIFQTLQPRDSVESTGIGLSIVKKIIEEHGGRIWVESEIGKGAKFIFTIPENNG